MTSANENCQNIENIYDIFLENPLTSTIDLLALLILDSEKYVVDALNGQEKNDNYKETGLVKA